MIVGKIVEEGYLFDKFSRIVDTARRKNSLLIEAEYDILDCRVLAIAPSTYHAHARRRAQPETAPARIRRDAKLMEEIRRVWTGNFQVYGVRKVWRQLLREGFEVARCTVARLMRKMALQGVIRGKRPGARPLPTRLPSVPLDHVNRQFKAPRPNVLWVADLHLRRDVDRGSSTWRS